MHASILLQKISLPFTADSTTSSKMPLTISFPPSVVSSDETEIILWVLYFCLGRRQKMKGTEAEVLTVVDFLHYLSFKTIYKMPYENTHFISLN